MVWAASVGWGIIRLKRISYRKLSTNLLIRSLTGSVTFHERYIRVTPDSYDSIRRYASPLSWFNLIYLSDGSKSDWRSKTYIHRLFAAILVYSYQTLLLSIS